MINHKEIIYQYETIFEPNGSGYTVTVPKLPGLVTEGENLKESREMAKDAIRCHLEGILKDNLLTAKKISQTRKEKISITI